MTDRLLLCLETDRRQFASSAPPMITQQLEMVVNTQKVNKVDALLFDSFSVGSICINLDRKTEYGHEWNKTLFVCSA